MPPFLFFRQEPEWKQPAEASELQPPNRGKAEEGPEPGEHAGPMVGQHGASVRVRKVGGGAEDGEVQGGEAAPAGLADRQPPLERGLVERRGRRERQGVVHRVQAAAEAAGGQGGHAVVGRRPCVVAEPQRLPAPPPPPPPPQGALLRVGEGLAQVAGAHLPVHRVRDRRRAHGQGGQARPVQRAHRLGPVSQPGGA